MADNLFKSIGPVDELPLFKLAGSIIMEAPGKLAGAAVKGANAMIDGATAAFESVSSTALGAVANVKSMMGREAPSVEVARAPEVSAPATAKASQYEVSTADLGSFSSPTFSAVSVQSGIGRG